MSTAPTSQTLLGRLRDPADAVAWREFEDQYRDLVVGYCLRRGLQLTDAEDVLQVVLMSMSTLFRRGFDRQPRKGPFRAYLASATRNAIHRWRRSPRREIQRLSTEVSAALAAEGRPGKDEVWEEEWHQHHIRRALRVVRPTFDPESLRMFEAMLSGQSLTQIAQEFGTTREALYKVRSRVRSRVEEQVARQIKEEDGA